MIWRGRWVRVPDLTLPAVDVDAYPRIGVLINREWQETLLSLVQHADQQAAWESDDVDRIEQQAYKLWDRIRKARGLIGAIIPYATEEAPPGTLPCDGNLYERADYPALYDLLGLQYQADPNFFRTPDLRGQFILGAMHPDYPVYSAGGEREHTLTAEEMPEHIHEADPHTHEADPHSHSNTPHTHGYTQPTFGVDIESVGVPDPTGVGNPPVPMTTSASAVSIDNANVTLQETTVSIQPSGGGQAHNNMPPYIAFNYAIVAY